MTQQTDTGFRMTGRKVLIISISAFAVILTANLSLAWNALRTFPGLEVQNSFVASQNFNDELASQLALGWSVTARAENDILTLAITDADGQPAQIAHLDATLGAATHVRDDQVPDFVFVDGVFQAPVTVRPGNWNIRLFATAADGTEFRQRVVLHVR